MNSNYQNLWLHDEDQESIILPYTTIDNIKIKNKNNNFTDFSVNYNQLQQNINSNETRIDNIEQDINSRSSALWGERNPNAGEGKNGDIFVQYKNGAITKIYQKIGGNWLAFTGSGGPNITVRNIDTSGRPQIGITVKVSNAP